VEAWLRHAVEAPRDDGVALDDLGEIDARR